MTEAMNDKAELLPCPFCGGKSHMADTGNIWCVCDDCGAEGPVDDSPEAAITKWNTRHSASVQSSEVRGEEKRVTGCINQVEEAACLIWAELCPGMVMSDADLPHYEAAAKAVIALSARPDAAGTKSAPDCGASQNIAERDPSVMAGSSGADTFETNLSSIANDLYYRFQDHRCEPVQAMVDALKELLRDGVAQAQPNRGALIELLSNAYNEGFNEGMREHTSHKGGWPWSSRKQKYGALLDKALAIPSAQGKTP